MEFIDSLKNILCKINNGFLEYHGQRVSVKINNVNDKIEGDLVGISSDGTISLDDKMVS